MAVELLNVVLSHSILLFFQVFSFNTFDFFCFLFR